jgi:hypothetical protein
LAVVGRAQQAVAVEPLVAAAQTPCLVLSQPREVAVVVAMQLATLQDYPVVLAADQREIQLQILV